MNENRREEINFSENADSQPPLTFDNYKFFEAWEIHADHFTNMLLLFNTSG